MYYIVYNVCKTLVFFSSHLIRLQIDIEILFDKQYLVNDLLQNTCV